MRVSLELSGINMEIESSGKLSDGLRKLAAKKVGKDYQGFHCAVGRCAREMVDLFIGWGTAGACQPK